MAVRDPLPEVEAVAGLDIRGSIVGLTVVHYWTQQVDTSFGVFCPPSYCADHPFRRIILAAHALAKLTRRPGALMVRARSPEDIHPDVLGLMFDLPTVACCPAGSWPQPDFERGARSRFPGVNAWNLRTQADERPILVVPGHRADLESSIDLVLGLSNGRYPVPLTSARRLTALLSGREPDAR
ncbi:MAG: hypothetical protein HY319_28965 [Armatimonadetes bacterium]|nr:hypothetical protein [Armatimonadota bacterium]